MAIQKKIAGIYSDFAAFSKDYDLGSKALREGLTAKESGFAKSVLRTGEYMGSMTPEMVQGVANGMQFDPMDARANSRPMPHMPYPRQKQRDDLEEQYIPRVRPF